MNDHPRTAPAVEHTPSAEADSSAIQNLLGPEPGDELVGRESGVELAVRLALLREEREELEAKLAAVKSWMKKIEPEFLDWMAQNSSPRGTWSRTTLYVTEKIFAQARQEAIEDGSLAEALIEIEVDPETMIVPSVNGNTLSALARELIQKRREQANDLKTKTAPAEELLPRALLAAIKLTAGPKVGYRAVAKSRR